MSAATHFQTTPMHTSDAPQMSDVPLLDWLSARGVRANLLVQAGPIDTGIVAQYLMKWCPTPHMLSVLPGDLTLPRPATGTWFLQDVEAMTERQQYELDRWLTGEGKGIQLVSISKAPLWKLVGRGQFLDTLYYRLNTIVIDAAPINGRANYDGGTGPSRP